MKINEAYFLISGIQTHHNIHTAPDSQGQARLGTGLGGSAFCMAHIDVPEQAVGWFPVGLELTVKDRSSKCIIPSSLLVSKKALRQSWMLVGGPVT